MKLAPETPSIETLEALHPLSNIGKEKVHQKRIETTDALRFGESLLVIIGPCAMTEDREELLEENKRVAAFGDDHNATVLHRIPPHKPRTNLDDWHGLETSNPELAHLIIRDIAEQSGNLAIELRHQSHIRRYLTNIAFGWRGSRNDGDNELFEALKASDPFVPLALKNGMSGSIDTALHESLQLGKGRDAPVVPLFRGGSTLDTKEKWVKAYGLALKQTAGNVIVDLAHGGEQAHDPRQQFAKSALGQLACLKSVIAVTQETGVLPRGIMIEASNITSPTDPVVPLEEALAAVKELIDLHDELHVSTISVAAD